MSFDAGSEGQSQLAADDLLESPASRWLRRAELFALFVGFVAAVAQQSLPAHQSPARLQLGLFVFGCVALTSLCWYGRLLLSRARRSFRRQNWMRLAAAGVWFAGIVLIGTGFERLLPGTVETHRKLHAVGSWSEIFLFLCVAVEAIVLTRNAAAGGANPSVIVVTTFGLLIAIGTTLLMLPMARGVGAPIEEPFADRLRVAVFTSTSASCVTGLAVVPTGGSSPYWSRFGQNVILGMIQIGGLGIMTLGAFFALAVGRHMPIRERATMRDALEIERLGDVRRLVLGILLFTLACELTGAVLLWDLWSAELPWEERAYFSLFHSVSAFCNAGFALTENSLVGYSTRWQVFAVIPGLIILGGLGFGVLQNTFDSVTSRLSGLGWLRHNRTFRDCHVIEKHRPVRLSLTSRVVLITTGALLVTGAVLYFVLEWSGHDSHQPFATRVSDAWFQSVTFRTAGFNTVDHEKLQPATKLFAITLMFIGASPGSTGGGVKTTCFALAVLGVVSTLRGRTRVEIFHRTIPGLLVNRALTIITLALVTLMSATLLLTIIENDATLFIDHLFEAASAFGTVGVSANLTPRLTATSQYVLAVTMFLGRVGPLTLLVAVAGTMRDEQYEYPIERVTLG